MAVKNINKINSLNLFGFIKRFPKDTVILGWAPHRNVTSCNQLKRHAQKKNNVPNYSNVLSKTSATRQVNEENSRNGVPFDGRQFENQLAAERIRQSNEILKDHYLKRRHMLRTLIYDVKKPIPEFSKKLKGIMAQETDDTNETVSADMMRTSHDYPSRRCRPEAKDDLTEDSVKDRHMKFHKRRQINSDVDELPELDDYLATRRSRKAAKVLRPPDSYKYGEIKPTEFKEHRLLAHQRERVKKMWQIGSRQIPRLE
ncbi:PREDICTED: uncharacterized protein LOC108610478 isoform X1 [Drosophila arizonae]|uniref:Uncharacterized protein LOC108610478 isoform X1 n=1 Tax=Drosophila arizonae TaxID=7263 RepID=A0ABM1NT11_DROAR|nr:PREDICTED: uncharacterized protein LOC108610478 isoform X1 [Drosophila arizonae]